MKFLKIYLLTLVLGSMLILPASSLILAADNLQTCKQTEDLKTCQARILQQAGGGASGYGNADNLTINESTLAEKIGQVIGMVLSVFGVVFFGMVTYSGIQWLTAGGNEEKVTHARERIIRAAIGLGVVMMSYALTSFIVSRMQPTNAPTGGNACEQAGGHCVYSLTEPCALADKLPQYMACTNIPQELIGQNPRVACCKN